MRFEAVDLFDPSLTSARFDAVLALNVLHLLEDPPRYLRRLHTLLAPDGLLMAETPCLAQKPWHIRTVIRLAGFTRWLPRVHMLDEENGDPWLVARSASQPSATPAP